ncbi:cytosolic sulfotransferase 15-like [Iris pallida]|uniref:Sulfotransferase n=1 Tax=Iris pallida TaxID=29817 RepID=A0AAX6GJD9_IRIPA|nr:cytosolic sulfotransferase 15-like [Iris pallida]
MEQSHQPPLRTEQEHEEEVHQRVYQQCRDLVSSLPVEGCCYLEDLCFHSGFFQPIPFMVGSMMVQKLFEARPTDIIMATLPKSGTTWLKALLFATVNRNSSPSSTGNLATLNPHQCVPYLEFELYGESRVPDMDSIPPRGFWPHISRSISYPTPLSTPDVESSTYAVIPRTTSCPCGTSSINSERRTVRRLCLSRSASTGSAKGVPTPDLSGITC